MKLVSFTQGDSSRIGALENEEVVDFSQGAAELPTDMLAFLRQGEPAMEQAREICASRKGRLDLADVTLEAPIGRPPKILAVGLNYKDHVEEAGVEVPEVPMIFNKQATSVTGPHGDIYLPRESEQLDYEGEMGIVIGRRCRRVPKEKAPDVIAGYTVVNDVSLRDWQFRTQTLTMGKSWDSHCPMGPAIVTPEEVIDPHHLSLKTWVNDELRQDSNTENLIFSCFEIIEYLSTAFTLEPGDLIPTGTPAGVILGMDEKIWLRAGDIVRVSIDRIGVIENRVVKEPEFV